MSRPNLVGSSSDLTCPPEPVPESPPTATWHCPSSGEGSASPKGRALRMLGRTQSFENALAYSILASGCRGGRKPRRQAILTVVEGRVYWSRLGWPEAHRGR